MGKKLVVLKSLLKVSAEPYHIVMLGLDGCGKTTILYRMKLCQNIFDMRPTTAFNVENVNVLKQKFRIWDVSGNENLRSLWKTYIRKSDGIIFVIDSGDKERFDEAKVELEKILNYEGIKNLPILILANKKDIKNSISPIELSQKLNFDSLDNSVKWCLFECTNYNDDGLNDAMTQLLKMVEESVNKSKDNKYPSSRKIGCFESIKDSEFI